MSGCHCAFPPWGQLPEKAPKSSPTRCSYATLLHRVAGPDAYWYNSQRTPGLLRIEDVARPERKLVFNRLPGVGRSMLGCLLSAMPRACVPIHPPPATQTASYQCNATLPCSRAADGCGRVLRQRLLLVRL